MNHHGDPDRYYEGGWHHHHGHGGGWGRGGSGRSRMRRGDVRVAILALLTERPMHGYQLMQAIAERGNGRWTPSPGAIYPAISQLEDEGLVTVTAQSGRKLAALTEAGREAAQTQVDQAGDLFAAEGPHEDGPDLRSLLGQLNDATRQVARGGTNDQIVAAAEILNDARRSMYLLLAGETSDGHE